MQKFNSTNFFKNKKCEYKDVLKDVQSFIAKNYHSKLNIKNEKGQIKLYIDQFLTEHRIEVDNLSQDELSSKLYREMAEYSFLTDYFNRNDIEEININSWDDIKIHYSNGDIKPSEETFLSPDHAVDVIRRLLRESNMILDNSNPLVRGHLAKNIRITVIGRGVIDDDVGVVASIRFINPKKLGREDFIKDEMMSEEMIDTIQQLYNHDISMCITGSTGTGKTTFMAWLLSTISDDKRLFTIEEETREFDLVKRDEEGNIINSVIHTVTNKSKKIDQEKLLELALTSDPDFICVSEMKGSEAFSAQEAARTAHTVITTTHANSCDATYSRMVTLCKTKYDMKDETLYDLVTEAFPIVMFVKKLGRKRKFMEVKECIIHEDGRRERQTLFKYVIKSAKRVNGKVEVFGEFKKINNISKQLQKRLIENGMPQSTLDKLLKH